MCPVGNLILLVENWLLFIAFLGFLPTFSEMTPNYLCLCSTDPPKITIFVSQNNAVTMGKPGVTLEKVPIF